MERQKNIVIVGPTASGKTSLSIALAQKYSGEVISADSRQVYRGLDLGTGKVTREEMDGVPHHLLDVADPGDVYTVADFVRDGHIAIADITSRGNLPIIAGGTFLYVDALLGRVSMPKVAPNQELRERYETMSNEELLHILTEKDVIRAQSIDGKNKRRLIRALEIVEALGAVPAIQKTEPYDTLTLGITIPKEQLHANIHTRLTARLDAGMIEEVEHLHRSGLTYERMHNLGLEYRYIAKFLQGEISREEMVILLEIKIRQFAKRQMTWLKRDTTIHWVSPHDTGTVTHLVENFLRAQ